jgi:hypothetical protein
MAFVLLLLLAVLNAYAYVGGVAGRLSSIKLVNMTIF